MYSSFRYCTAKITCYKLGLIVPLILLSRTLNFYIKRLRLVVQKKFLQDCRHTQIPNAYDSLYIISLIYCIYTYILPSTLHAKGWGYSITQLICNFQNFFAHPLYRPSDFLTDFHNIFLIFAELYYLWFVRKISCSYSF